MTAARKGPRRLGRGPKSPSISEVASRAGVSIATVSRVLNGVSARYSEGTADRVRKAIKDLNYRPTSVGRALRQGESRLVAVLAANLANPTMTAIAASTERALREAGYVMVLCDTHDDPDIQDEYLLEMRAQFATAIVLLGAVTSPQLGAFREAGERLIFVNRRDPMAKEDPFIGIDNYAAGLRVADLFVERGERGIGVIHGPLTSSATEDRVSGFRDRLREVRPDLKPQIVTADADDHLRLGYQATGLLLARFADTPSHRPANTEISPLNAIFCLSDLIAFGALRRLIEAGRSVPQDVRLIGFDDTPLNDWIAPWLTSVRVPYEAFGPAIVDALSRVYVGEASTEIILDHKLVCRDGTYSG